MRRYGLFVPLFVSVFTVNVFAVASKTDFQIFSLRQRAMGDVGTAVMFDEMALVNNPAGLAYSKFDIDFMRGSIAAGQAAIDKVSEFRDLSNKKDDDGAMAQAIKDLVPTNIDATLSLTPIMSMTAPGFGIGLFTQTDIHGSLKRKTDPTFVFEMASDSAPAVGLAHEFDIWGPTALGFSVKAPFRARAYDKQTGDTSLELNLTEIQKYISDKSDKKEPGAMLLQGVAFDLGMLRSFDSYKYGKGYYGFAVRNLGGSLTGDQELKINGGTQTRTYTEELPVVSSVGFSYDAPLGNIPRVGPLLGNLLIAGDWKFISPYSDYKRNLHVGIEKKLWFLKLRGGINGGYFVGGAGIDFKLWIFDLIHLDYANYTEELGKNLGDRPVQYQALELQLLF